MNNRATLVAAGLVAILAVIGSVYAGYHFSSAGAVVKQTAGQGSPETEPRDGLKTSSMALPDKTNNAWEIPPFKLKGLDGEEHRLDEWKGKVIMLNFWASWCGPCQYEIPEFVAYQETYEDKGLQVVGIGIDEERKLRNVARSLEMNYPVLILDPFESRKLLTRWGNENGLIPHTVVIDTDGRIRYIHRGKMGEREFNTYVLPLLN